MITISASSSSLEEKETMLDSFIYVNAVDVDAYCFIFLSSSLACESLFLGHETFKR